MPSGRANATVTMPVDDGGVSMMARAHGGEPRARLTGSSPEDPEERVADRLAEEITAPEHGHRAGAAAAGPASLPAPPNDRGPGIGGLPLPGHLAAEFGQRLGRDLDGVRLHTGHDAHTASRELGARAFTVGSDIAFAAGEYQPDSPRGRRLLAHELAHVVHAPRLPGKAYRQPDHATADAPVTDPGAPVYGPEFTQDVRVGDPVPQGDRKEQQTFRLHEQSVGPPLDLTFWVVPISSLQRPTGTNTATSPTPAHPAATTMTPPVAGTVTPPAGGTPTPPAPHPQIPSGSTVRTLDGARLTALASTPEHVITAEYTKYAVGAGSTSAIKLRDGSVIVIDAGVNAKGIGTTMQALEALVMSKLEAFIGSGVIREILISHAHGDHVSLAPAIMRRFVVELVRINDVMRRWSGAKNLRTSMKAAEAARIEAAEKAFAEGMQAKRAAWETGEGQRYAPTARDAEWRRYVRSEFEKSPQGRTATERVLVQTRGNVLDVIDFDLATGERKGPVPFATDDPYAVAETQKPADTNRVTDRRRRIEARDIDKYATSYVITLKSGLSFLILPDLRAADLTSLMANFRKIMGDLDRPVQIWDATHHMQKGLYKIAGSAPASQLAKVAEFLMEFRSSGGSDAVVVSAQVNTADPTARTLVDPVVIRLLSTLGFEAYLAESGRDIRVLDITTSTGKKVAGIVGAQAPGAGDPKLSGRRALLALQKLAAERQAKKVESAETTDATKKAELNRRIAEITALEAELKSAYTEMLTEMEAKLRSSGGHTSSTLAQAAGKDFPKQAALDALLERHGFDLPVTRSLQLTETALVLLNRPPDLSGAPPGSPGARAREIAGVRTRIRLLGERMKGGTAPAAVQVELLTEYRTYEILLEEELNPKDPASKPMEGTSKDLLRADLAEVKTRIAALTDGPGTVEYSRTIGKGDLIAQHATKLRPMPPPESRALAGARKAADVVGRAGGLVMVTTTVFGEGDLMARYAAGKATGAEAAVGTVHNLAAGGVGLMMLKGLPVHPGVFVVLAVLEVTEAAMRNYETEEQKDIAMYHAAARAGVNLACMGLGMALMAIPTPVTVIAGLIITTVGPLLLNALGLDEWLANWAERRGAFNPSEVVEVLQKLRKLLKSYQLVVGALQLAKRSEDPGDPTFRQLPDATARAAAIRKEESAKALTLEAEILTEFEEAYKDAKTNYAGLKDLDDYRAQFYALRHEAGLSTVSATYHGVFGIRDPDKVFAAIDQTMSMDALTSSDVGAMPQWVKLYHEQEELKELVNGELGAEYHKKVRDKDKRVQAMIDNVRYRIEPEQQGGQRTVAMIRPGTPGYSTYRAAMKYYERQHAEIRRRYAERTSGLCGVSLTPPGTDPTATAPMSLNKDWVLSMVEGTIRSYAIAVRTGFGPPDSLVVEMAQHSEALGRYEKFVADHGWFAGELDRLETTERMIDGQLVQAHRTIEAETGEARDLGRARLEAAKTSMKEARSDRIAKRGKLFPGEVAARRTEVWSFEVSQASALFPPAEQKVRALTEAEELALVDRREQFESDTRVRPPLSRRLSIVRSPTAVAADGTLANIFRLTGEVPLNLRYATKPVLQVDVSENAIVGLLAAPKLISSQAQGVSYAEVFPLNDRAFEILGGPRGMLVYAKNLAPVKASELATGELKTTAP
jgi:hypothetical protein